LLEKRSPDEKSVLLALERVHRLKIQEEVRSKLSSLDIQSEIQRTISVSARIEKYAESRKELDRRLDVQFGRKIAQVLDEHLSMVQSDHEQRSQIVERGIRDDAAVVEEAKRREQSMKEEELKQERIGQEAEARQKAAAQAEKAEYEAAKNEAVENEAAKSRAEAVSASSQISQNATMVDSFLIRSELLPGSKFMLIVLHYNGGVRYMTKCREAFT
jgi:nucleoporin GLE1